MNRKQIIFMLLIVAFTASVALACPLCKDTVTTAKNDLDQAGAASLGGGFNHSIYLMFGGLFTALSIVGFNLMKAIRGK
jgi:di/tricarboxylate transporter